MTSVSDAGPVNTNVPCPWIPANGPVPRPTVITLLCQIAPGEAALATIPERAAVIAQDLVEGKAKVTVGRNALDQVACDDAGNDRAVCQADVVQAAVNFSSARTIKRFPSPRCASVMKIVRPSRSTVATQPQLHPALLRLSAMISQYFTASVFYFFTKTKFCPDSAAV
jgi:hypothetical protein